MHNVGLLSRVLLIVGVLTASGCAIGGVDHPAYRATPPGENLVVDMARAVDRLDRVVRKTGPPAGHASPPQPLPRPEETVQHAEPLPRGPELEVLPPVGDGSEYCEISGPAPSIQPPCDGQQAVLAPPAAPPVGPPGRFFPVPTRPVFGPQ